MIDKHHLKITKAILNKMRKQLSTQPEHQLMFAVFSQAVSDLFDSNTRIRETAIEYMNGRILHLELMGIEKEWAHSLFKIAGLNFLYSRSLLNKPKG